MKKFRMLHLAAMVGAACTSLPAMAQGQEKPPLANFNFQEFSLYADHTAAEGEALVKRLIPESSYAVIRTSKHLVFPIPTKNRYGDDPAEAALRAVCYVGFDKK